MMEILKGIYNQPEINWLMWLIIGNLVLGVVASLRNRDFRLTKLADWLWSRVVPLIVGYGVVALLASANADWAPAKAAAYWTVVAALAGFILANLKEFGFNLPDPLAGKD